MQCPSHGGLAGDLVRLHSPATVLAMGCICPEEGVPASNSQKVLVGHEILYLRGTSTQGNHIPSTPENHPIDQQSVAKCGLLPRWWHSFQTALVVGT